MSFTAFVLHHSEAIDPTLADWIRHEIDAVVGLGPVSIVLVLGVLIVAFPLAVMVAARSEGRSMARPRRRRNAG